MYFFDTYALSEIISGNKNYDKYKNDIITTSTLNISEFYYFLLRAYNKKTADYLIKKLDFRLINIIKIELAVEASKFKFENKKEKLSYVDCIGYILAEKFNMKFLTGDEKFEYKKNVEFVK